MKKKRQDVLCKKGREKSREGVNRMEREGKLKRQKLKRKMITIKKKYEIKIKCRKCECVYQYI